MTEEESAAETSAYEQESTSAPASDVKYDRLSDQSLEDPRIVWILERIMAFFRTEDMDLTVRMLKKHDHRALKKLYKTINEPGSDWKEGFFVYQTQFKRRFKRNIRYMKIHLRENSEKPYKCEVVTNVRTRFGIFNQLHLHFGLHRWERFPYHGKIMYFLPRQKTIERFETLREAQAMMPKMYYLGMIDIRSLKHHKSLTTALQQYLRAIFLNPTNPFAVKSAVPTSLMKLNKVEMKRPSTFDIETSSSYMRKCEDIEKLLLAEDVPVFPTFNLLLYKRLENYGMTKRREKFNIYTIDDFLNPEVFAKNPKIRGLWYKKRKGPIPKFNNRAKVALELIYPPKSKMLMAVQKLLDDFDWCLAKVRNCTFNVLYTEYLGKLDLHKFDHDDNLKAIHQAFLDQVLEIWNHHIKNFLKYSTQVNVKGKGVLALYEFYKDRRDKISSLVFEMFHPIVENLLTFVSQWNEISVKEFKNIRGLLENFYIVCWDTCEYMEFCLYELEVIHHHKMLRTIIPCSTQFLNVLKMLLTLSYYWRTNSRFLDILHRLHYVIQTKIERSLNTEHLFKLPNRIATALCKDVINVSEYWQNTVEQDRAFSQKINFEKMNHLRSVAETIMQMLRVMKSYNHVYCQQCYDAENENYKLDAVVYEVKQLITPILNPGFDYLDVDNKVLWDELVNDFKKRCENFDKEASLLVIDAIKKTKSTKNIANILTHFKVSTKMFKMDSLFGDIFDNVDVSPQFSQEILHILEVFLKASYYKDSMRSFGYASKSMQWTRCLFYVVQKNLSILFSIGAALPNVYEKVITNYLRCVDIFTSYEVGLYKVWLKRFVNYTHSVVSRKLIQLAYDKEMPQEDDDGCRGFLEPHFFVKLPISDFKEKPANAYSYKDDCPYEYKEVCKYLPQFRPYLMDAFQEEQMEKLASLHSMSSDEEEEADGGDAGYKRNLLLKYGVDLDNWYAERYMLNYNFVTRLALGLCTQTDEQMEANVYFLLEQTLKRFINEDERIVKRRERSKLFDGCPNYFQTYDCCSSSGSVTRISELLTENTWSDDSHGAIKHEANRFLVDRDPSALRQLTELTSLKNDTVPLFIAIRENFRERINKVLGGDPAEVKKKFVQKTEEVLAVDTESECSEEIFLLEEDENDAPKVVSKLPDFNADLQAGFDRYNVLFKTPITNLYNYKELAFVLWLNGTKMKYVKPKRQLKGTTSHDNRGEEAHYTCTCGIKGSAGTQACPGCDFDWLGFNKHKLNKQEKYAYDSRATSSVEKEDKSSFGRSSPPITSRRKAEKDFRRGAIEKYEAPMNNIFEDEENADALFRKKFNIYLTKLINDSNQPGETIGPNELSSRIRGEVQHNTKRPDKSSFLYEITDDDMPDSKITHEMNNLVEVQKAFFKTTRGRFKRELQEAIRQADVGSSESEKALQALDYETEIRKTIPGIYTGCKHSLNKMNWTNFIGNDILKEHGYTIQANREPFTYVACRDIETLEEFGFTLPSETLAFAFNNFDRNKYDIFEIVTIYKGIIGQFPDAKLMALKKYIQPVERNICQGLRFCGLRTLNITKQCQELIVQMNTLAIMEILMLEVETSIKQILNTIGRLNFYRLPCLKSYNVKDFFNTAFKNCSHTQRRLTKLYKLIPKKLLKLETLLYQKRTGKCEYMITYYRCVEKTLFRKLISMIKANLFIFRKFALGELKARFYMTASIVEPSVSVTPELKTVQQHLHTLAEKIVRYQQQMPRWFDGTCAKVPKLKKKGKEKSTHWYSFGEDLLGSVEVVEELQMAHECISYVLDAVDNYIFNWGRFEHLWTEDIEDVFIKFSFDKPTVQDYFDVFSFYHDIIVEIYKMPDQVDIFCVRIKIKDMKKKVLMYALGWRGMCKTYLSDDVMAESQTLFLRMQNVFQTMMAKVASFRIMKDVLKTAYNVGNLETRAEIFENTIQAKNEMARLWIPQHLFDEDQVYNILKQNVKQIKTLAMYKTELLTPYLAKITPRIECIQCSTTGLTMDLKKTQSEFPKFFSMAAKDHPMGHFLKPSLRNVLEMLKGLAPYSPWSVVSVVIDHLQESQRVVELLRLLYPKLSVQRLATTKRVHELLNIAGYSQLEKKEESLDSLLKSLK